MENIGGDVSAQELSRVLGYPARTIRYRISTLKERGILLPPYIETHERKLGLGEGILVLQESQGKSRELEELIYKIPIFFWFVPTHGRFDGYLIHTVHDIARPRLIGELADKIKRAGLIDDYFFFDIVDYQSKRGNFSYYDLEEGWSWNWSKWDKRVQENVESDRPSPFTMTEKHPVIEFDSSDLQILKILKNDATTSTADIAEKSKLSLPQTRERIQRLRELEVIRGFRRAFGLAGDLLWFSCFIDINGPVGGVLSCFNELPFPGGIFMGSKRKYCLRFGLETSDLKQFLEGFRHVRPHLKSYSFQFQLSFQQESHYQDIFQLFDEQENKWIIPIADYMRLI